MKNNLVLFILLSTDKQTTMNQRFEIQQYCTAQNLPVTGWIQETISGTRAYDKRALGRLLRKVKEGDLIICTELSRLGRNLFMIMEILNHCMGKGCRVITIMEGYHLGENIEAKVLAFAFGLSAEIERQLISQRTTEALRRRKAEGIKLGRPKGSTPAISRVDAESETILKLLTAGTPKSRNRTPLPRLPKDAVQLVKTGINNRKLWKNQKADDYFIVFDYICLGINGPCCYEKKDNSTSY